MLHKQTHVRGTNLGTNPFFFSWFLIRPIAAPTTHPTAQHRHSTPPYVIYLFPVFDYPKKRPGRRPAWRSKVAQMSVYTLVSRIIQVRSFLFRSRNIQTDSDNNHWHETKSKSIRSEWMTTVVILEGLRRVDVRETMVADSIAWAIGIANQ